MPRTDPDEYRHLALRTLRIGCVTRGFPLHDVWRVELPDAGDACSIASLRALIEKARPSELPLAVRALFSIRRLLGRLLHVDGPRAAASSRSLVGEVPAELARASRVTPGSPVGAFVALYELPAEAAYEARNATVHAVLSVALVPASAGMRLYWATWVRPVGCVTRAYMALIDPFRRHVVYPGLEAWLVKAVRGRAASGAAHSPRSSDGAF